MFKSNDLLRERLVELTATVIDEEGVTQKDIAQKSGIVRSHLSQFINHDKGLGKQRAINLIRTLASISPEKVAESDLVPKVREAGDVSAPSDSGEPLTENLPLQMNLAQIEGLLQMFQIKGLSTDDFNHLRNNPKDAEMVAQMIKRLARTSSD